MNQERAEPRPIGVKMHVCEFGVTFGPEFEVERSYEPDEDRLRQLLAILLQAPRP